MNRAVFLGLAGPLFRKIYGPFDQVLATVPTGEVDRIRKMLEEQGPSSTT